MISRLLVANRGEIARRVVRSARAMGIETVAVYSDGDAGSPHVTDADRAVPLPGRTAAETYLNARALLDAAKVSGAGAVHPGYGFLSEQAAFGQAVIDAGLVWVGPPPQAIATMGDKLAAKRIMAKAGVPVLASVEAGDQLPAVAQWPALVKAAAGGGGKGMRIVERPEDLNDAVAAARREAAAAFGDPTVFVERYVPEARHVEIQVLADDHDHVIHLFERDCSIQRRHQKVIEEAPSPALDDDQRARMGAAAVAAARAVGYRNAGTVEFVLDPSGEFWFLEVNTRLQVEHPVTEAVTGLDLVREQLRIADGLPLSITQEQLAITGHAVEARLYAEDPAVGFLPATGTLAEWAPATDPALRWDSGVQTGSVVATDFDPLLAKVVAHAPTRQEAVARLALGLARSRLRGVTTNRDFLVAALRHPDFVAGHATTEFVERSGVALARQPTAGELRAAAIAAALADDAARRAAGPMLATSGWRNSVLPAETITYSRGEEELTVGLRVRRDGSFAVDASGWSGPARVRDWDGATLDLDLDGQRHRLHILLAGETVWVQGADGDVALRVQPRFPTAVQEAAAGALVAPMPGKVLAVDVKLGQTVDAGQLLLILEAMKMEHRLAAPHAGTVVEVRAKAGDQVAGGDPLVVVEPAPDG